MGLDWTWKELVGDSKIRFRLDIVATSQEQTKALVQHYIYIATCENVFDTAEVLKTFEI